MVSFTTLLNGRKGRQIQPTPAEAMAMQALGFQFTTLAPRQGQVELARPIRLIIAPEMNLLTFEQG